MSSGSSAFRPRLEMEIALIAQVSESDKEGLRATSVSQELCERKVDAKIGSRTEAIKWARS